MLRILSAISSFLLSAIALHAARKSYIAIVNLRHYEERSERAAKHSDTAAHELYKTRVTQATSAAAPCALPPVCHATVVRPQAMQKSSVRQ
ncbi:MAG: hypothetical protein L6R41_003944 [Letrouitia leprolyta]|nr:MAG: hypothetical protein L6R41_003944 [Letrouitia leprolyta]